MLEEYLAARIEDDPSTLLRCGLKGAVLDELILTLGVITVRSRQVCREEFVA
jgi:hypothetical protein